MILPLGRTGRCGFTEQLQNKIGRVDPKTGVFKKYALKTEGSGPHGLVADSNGNIWFTGNGKGHRTEKFARATIPSGGGTVRHMAATADGRVYIACSSVNKVGVVEPAR